MKMEGKDAFACVGRRLKTGGKDDRFFKDIAAFEDEHKKNGFFRALASLAGTEDRYNICDWSRYQQGEDDFKFDIVFAIMKPEEEPPAELELEEFEIPALMWVIFSVQEPVTSEMDDAMGTLNDYDYAFNYEIDHYPEGRRSSDDYVLTKWLPIRKKSDPR